MSFDIVILAYIENERIIVNSHWSADLRSVDLIFIDHVLVSEIYDLVTLSACSSLVISLIESLALQSGTDVWESGALVTSECTARHCYRSCRGIRDPSSDMWGGDCSLYSFTITRTRCLGN